VVAVGQDRPYVTVLINIDLGAVGNWAERRSLGYTSYTDLAQKTQVYEQINEEVKRVNKSLAEDEQLKKAQIHKFLILHKELDPDDQEITRTRKIRRRFIAEKYADIYKALYEEVDHVNVTAIITYEDGRKAEIESSLRIQQVDIDQASFQ
jgi:long-chain acyl-CoA synthetase